MVIGGGQPSGCPLAGLGAIEIDHVDDLVSPSERRVVVRDEEQGFAFLPADGEKGLQDLPGRVDIQAGAGFIRKDQRRAVGQGPRDGHPLLLASREVLGPVGEASVFGRRACDPNDSYPDGAVVDGWRKASSTTPFGKACFWEKAGR